MSKALRMVDPGVKGFEPRGPKLTRDQMMTEFHKPTDKRVFAIAQVQYNGVSYVLFIHRFTCALAYTVKTPIRSIHPCNPPYPHHNSLTQLLNPSSCSPLSRPLRLGKFLPWTSPSTRPSIPGSLLVSRTLQISVIKSVDLNCIRCPRKQ